MYIDDRFGANLWVNRSQIVDGRGLVCRCYFNVALGRIVRLEWNREV
ncbi:MAG TPA: hypothetical protein VGP07_04955 [Polyangia bacterium]